MKPCSSCKQELPLESFARNKTRPDGRTSKCKKCSALYMREYYKRNPDKKQANVERQRVRDARAGRKAYHRHGLSTEQFDLLRSKYNGKCWACQENEGTSVDHDHNCCTGAWSCGKCVRGILCHHCNTALGLSGDSPERLIRLINYLRWR